MISKFKSKKEIMMKVKIKRARMELET